jgi:hypothetical protein
VVGCDGAGEGGTDESREKKRARVKISNHFYFRIQPAVNCLNDPGFCFFTNHLHIVSLVSSLFPFLHLLLTGAGVGNGLGAVPCVYLNGQHAPMTSSDEFQVFYLTSQIK